MIKAIIFDLDDTLYEENTYVLSAFKEVSRYISEKYKLIELDIYNSIIAVFENEGRGKIFNKICEEYNLEENIEVLIDIYRNSTPKIKLYEDSIEVIQWAKKMDYKLGIITDGAAIVQWKKIKALELANKIDKIIVADDLGKEFWKPHKKPYIKILSELKVEPEEAIYIGDNPNKDFIGAKSLGIRTIRIIRESGDYMKIKLSEEHEADFHINESLENIKKILEGGLLYG